MKFKKVIIYLISLSVIMMQMTSIFADELETETNNIETEETAAENVGDNIAVEAAEQFNDVGGNPSNDTVTIPTEASVKKKAEPYFVKLKDTELPLYKMYLEFFSAIGLDFGIKNADTAISRMDYAKMLVKLKGIDSDLSDLRTKEYFEDVKKSDKDAGYVNYVYEEKLMSAKSGKKFLPKDSVSVEEAVVSCVKLLGYQNYYQIDETAKASEYLNVARKIGILSGISQNSFEKGLGFEDCIKLLYNMFDTEVVEFKANTNTYSIARSEKKYMTVSYNVEYETGVMYSNGITSFKTGVSKNDIVIGSEHYSIDPVIDEQITAENNAQAEADTEEKKAIDITDKIGKRVTAYYIDDKGDRELVYLTESNKNQIITIYGSEIDSFDDFTYSYTDEKGKQKSEKLMKSINIIYNGACVDNKTMAKVNYKPEHGYVEIIDNNGDNEYDVLVINDYQCYSVSSINKLNEYILPKDSNERIYYSKDKYDNIKIYDINRKALLTDNIVPNKSIAVLESLDKSLISITVYDKTAKGVISSIQKDINNYSVTIQDKIYSVPLSKTQLFNIISTGQTVNLMLDLFGGVYGVAIEGDSAYSLCYLIRAYIDNDNDDKVSIKYYDSQTASVAVKPLKDKLKVDENSCTSLYAFNKYLNDEATHKTKYQIMRIKCNGNGEVSYIDLADNTTNILTKSTGNLQVTYKSTNISDFTQRRVTFNGYMYNGRGYIRNENRYIQYDLGIAKADIPVMYVPSNRQDEASYAMKTLNDYQAKPYVIDFYKISNSGLYPDFAVAYGGTGEPEEGSSDGVNHNEGIQLSQAVAAVEKIATIVNDKDDLATQLTLLEEGKRYVKEVYDNILAVEKVPLKVGDIIQYTTNGDDKIWGIDIIVSRNDFNSVEGIKGEVNPLNEFMHGLYNAYYRDGDVLLLTMKDPKMLDMTNLDIPVEVTVFSMGAFKYIHYYDKEAKQFVKADATYIETYCNDGRASKVFVRGKTGGKIDMYIYDADAFK